MGLIHRHSLLKCVFITSVVSFLLHAGSSVLPQLVALKVHYAWCILNPRVFSVYETLIGKDDFQASNRWLDKFKNLYGIKMLITCCERLSANDEDAKEFCKWLSNYSINNNIDLDNVYNAKVLLKKSSEANLSGKRRDYCSRKKRTQR